MEPPTWLGLGGKGASQGGQGSLYGVPRAKLECSHRVVAGKGALGRGTERVQAGQAKGAHVVPDLVSRVGDTEPRLQSRRAQPPDVATDGACSQLILF